MSEVEDDWPGLGGVCRGWTVEWWWPDTARGLCRREELESEPSLGMVRVASQAEKVEWCKTSHASRVGERREWWLERECDASQRAPATIVLLVPPPLCHGVPSSSTTHKAR